MLYKSAVYIYIFSLLSLIAIFLGIIYTSDPYMMFHKHWFHHGQMYNNARIQNYGLIKYGKLDSLILGSSMLENTSAVEASEKLGGLFANISVSGVSHYERYKILDFALNKRKIKHIILSLDYHFNIARHTGETFIPELYSPLSLVGKFKIYSTDKALHCIFKNEGCDFINYSLDRPYSWYQYFTHDRRFGGFANWIKYYKEDNQIKDAFNQLKSGTTDYSSMISLYKEIIDSEIMPLFKHKETQFSVVIPPYSILWWSKRKNSLDALLKPYTYLIEQTADYDNVKLYWFYDEDYVSDISKYKDLSHYHYSINSLQLDALKNKTNIINTQNYRQKFREFSDKVNTFDLDTYIKQIPNN